MLELITLLLTAFALAEKSGPTWWYDETHVDTDKPTMVHLFEWKWTDIAKECEDFLQHYGYGAVQVSPPNEHIIFNQENKGKPNTPWYVRYQPVSYKLESRSGTREEFINMVNRCNNVRVRIIVDVVINHMVGMGNKKGEYGKNSTGSSDFDGRHYHENFPEVPYDRSHTNYKSCDEDIKGEDYKHNADRVKLCRLVGLIDLDHKNEHVRNVIVNYLNDLISLGVAGFRIDASKHMYGEDLKIILDRVNDLRSDIFGENKRPFAVHEVIDRGGEACTYKNFIQAGRYTDFNFGAPVSAAAKKYGGNFKWLANMGPGYGGYGNDASHNVLSFIDNHDNQRDEKTHVVTYKDGDKYKMAVGFMLAWPYGYSRVMSSFYFEDREQGPPSTHCSATWCYTDSPSFKDDKTCAKESGWVCEHRWPEIRRMALFRKHTVGTAATQIVTDDNRLAFARLGKGYFAVNNDWREWKLKVQTTLPDGLYCDVYSGEKVPGSCTGVIIAVKDGMASFTVPSEKFVAFHVGARIGDDIPVTPKPIPSSWETTVILLKRETNIGDYVFIRGGNTQSKETIPIAHQTETPFTYSEYQSWSQGDTVLDFEDYEESQGTHFGRKASGTPLAYSTNDSNALEYQKYNTFGPGYWMVVLKMDCSKTHDGWFDFKGYQTPNVNWEKDIQQDKCEGEFEKHPYKTNNHVGRCGYLNVFEFNSNNCVIKKLSISSP
ncbi:hypothetical protein AB6A40_003204 [Gnathostoma spinigerum]|uniref:Alpha-amylase n=1 Tax=Gnathostoma spinigerum TaxID=75299 RepID=A0ABD6EA19_9BILA